MTKVCIATTKVLITSTKTQKRPNVLLSMSYFLNVLDQKIKCRRARGKNVVMIFVLEGLRFY